MKKRMIHTLAIAVFDAGIVFLSYIFGLLVRFDLRFQSIPAEYLLKSRNFLPIAILVTILLFVLFHMYSFVWHFISLREGYQIVFVVIFTNMTNFLISIILQNQLPLSIYIIAFLFQLIAMFVLRFSVKIYKSLLRSTANRNEDSSFKNTLVIGAGSTGEIIVKEIITSKHLHLNVRCFIDDNVVKHGKTINGITIVGGRDKIFEAVGKYAISVIIIAIPTIKAKDRKEILDICQQTSCELKIVPGVYQVLNGDVHLESIRNVEIQDLLDREQITVDLNEIMNYVENRVVLVTGGGGSIGSEICRQIARYQPKQLVIFDIYENNAYDIQLELQHDYPELSLQVLIGSVRDSLKVENLFMAYQPEIIFHAAAHKHVPLMEDSPNEAIKNNVFGTYNVAAMADKYKVHKMVIISTDKAVNPTNIMGASKRLCEMVIQYFSRRSKTEFVAVRFGNVLGSNGSVIPIFKKQIAAGGPVTVTHPEIIRYFMTIPEAVSLVLQAGAYAKGGEIFVLDMGKPVSIDAMAQNLIKLSGYVPDVDIMIKYTGLRPGEKLFEELLMDEEGIGKTPNSQIYVGSPIAMDDDQFKEQLHLLRQCSNGNSPDIKNIVSQIVPTYKPSSIN